MCVLDGVNTWSLIRPEHESSLRSVQLIRRWGLFRESTPGMNHNTYNWSLYEWKPNPVFELWRESRERRSHGGSGEVHGHVVQDEHPCKCPLCCLCRLL
jgi:hypothetical protein